MNNIKNFAIIAHIDHGKSTLADRLLELTGVVKSGAHDDQLLDRNPISRERGITIKLAPVRMNYHLKTININTHNDSKDNPSTIILNLIDTPGHVDFSYEVDRTLSCVEGVVLLVDATQGIQAQTISNAHKAIDKNLVIIPVINKIDLPSADVEKTKQQLIDFLGIDKNEILTVSAKTGQGVETLLDRIINQTPNPNTNRSSLLNNQLSESISNNQSTKTQALIFDSYYDSHRGVIAFVRVFTGSIKKGDKVKLAINNINFVVNEVGYFLPDLQPTNNLQPGEIGYIVTNLKDIHKVRVGDTISGYKDNTALPGYKQVKPMVYASIFTTDTGDYLNLKKALEKLYLNDSSLIFNGIYSQALGAGFRVGFLGLLHADVVRERLEREFNLSLVLTPPKVEFKYDNQQFYEPYVKLMIVAPDHYVGSVIKLVQDYRGEFITMDNKNQTVLTYHMPMSEMITDFFDNLKSVSSGFASLDWEFFEYRLVKADKLEILINDNLVEEFSEIVVNERAFKKGEALVKKIRTIIPRQQYEVKIQARFKGKVIASERISPFRKDVLVKNSKVVGAGDVGRKKKLLEKQKEGKKKMKMVGKVEIPKESFMKLFKNK